MKFLSLEPFVPSGRDYEGARQFFQELGFSISWETGDYTGFERDGCRFILQRYNNKAFAENFMVSVRVDDAEALCQAAAEKRWAERFGVRVGQPKMQPYGKEVNIIDGAGVCWHFVE